MRDLQPAELANNRSLRRSLGNNCCYFYYFDNYRPVFAQKSRKPRNPYPNGLMFIALHTGIRTKFDRSV